MKHIKKLLALCLTLALVLSLAACGKQEEQPPETTPASYRIAALKGPTAMGLVKLMQDAAGGTVESGNTYDFTLAGSADEVTPALIKGELDMACVPANLAAVLYGKTEGAVEVLAVNTLGVLYIVENGSAVQSIADLKGQTIVAAGKGSTPEYALRYLLSENGIDPDNDVTIEYCSEATEALSKVQAGEATIAMLPQPFVTSALSQVEGLRVALDMNEEWQKVAGSKLVTGVLVVRKDAVEADADRFAAFMDAYQASVDAANTDLEGTAALCEEYGIVAKAALAQKALPQCNIVFETGDQMKADLTTYYQVLFDADPTSVGGSMPADDFYYAG